MLTIIHKPHGYDLVTPTGGCVCTVYTLLDAQRIQKLWNEWRKP